jgi:hypothetical protein
LRRFAGEGSPYNKVAGLGFAGVPDGAALDDIEKAFLAGGAMRIAEGVAQPVPPHPHGRLASPLPP